MPDDPAMSFAKDIRPMFTDTDIDHMEPYGLDLSSRDEVAGRADEIYTMVKEKTMPPPASGLPLWSDEMCERFAAWQRQGCPP